MGIPGLQGQTQARLGRYELLARIATGGMGEIFLARLEGAEGFEKLYVVKRILPHLADDTRFRQMLVAEARIASKLSHANICQVYELGETDGQLYIAMEYLEGVTLLPLLRRLSRAQQPLELGFVAGVVQQTCDALHYAHELKDRGEALGLVHRDVTPQNIFLTEAGVAKLLDFGIAKARGASTNTQEGTVKGKYAYMAPEQLRGGAIDRRVDIFALGVVVFEMLALRRLFQRKTDYLTFRAVMEQPIPDIRRYRGDVSSELADVLARALVRDPESRFETARQLGTAVLDTLGNRRPWSQGEISDFVRQHFADDLAARSTAVSAAVNRPTGPHGRSTLPMIAQPDTAPHDHDDDDETFPSVETDIDLLPAFPSTPQPKPRAASEPADFVEGTPPPFGAETTGDGLKLKPLRGQSPTPTGTNAQIVVVPQRSLVWPLLAIGMVAVAGGALWLVYQQTQKTQAPTSVVIQQGPDERVAPAKQASGATPVEAPPAANNDGSSSGSAVQPPASPADKGKNPGPAVKAAKPHPNGNPYLAAIEPKLGTINGCLTAHPDTAIPSAAKGLIVIAPGGHVKSVTWQPDVLQSSAVGACMRNVLMGITFPDPGGESTLTWFPGLTGLSR